MASCGVCVAYLWVKIAVLGLQVVTQGTITTATTTSTTSSTSLAAVIVAKVEALCRSVYAVSVDPVSVDSVWVIVRVCIVGRSLRDKRVHPVLDYTRGSVRPNQVIPTVGLG